MLTSSIGGIFPRGIIVGTVMEVSRDQNQQKYASILPAVDFARLENVLVITGETGFVEEPVDTANASAAADSPGTTGSTMNASPTVDGEKTNAG